MAYVVAGMDPPDQARDHPVESNATPSPLTQQERAKRRTEIIRATGFIPNEEREANARNRTNPPPGRDDD